MRMFTAFLFFAVVVLAIPQILPGAIITLNFEEFPDSTDLTTQYLGLTFSNTQILTAGIGLNELEFPPNSGTNVATDNGGPISILFAAPATSFSGNFTYTVPLTLKGFNGEGMQVVSATSKFANNLACLAGPPCSGQSGSSPNELLQVSSLTGISRVTITGTPTGGSFALDNATIDTSLPTSGVPEPSSLTMILVAAAGGGLAASRKGRFSVVRWCRSSAHHRTNHCFSDRRGGSSADCIDVDSTVR